MRRRSWSALSAVMIRPWFTSCSTAVPVWPRRKQSAGIDLGKLFGIPDKDQLGVGLGDLVDECGEASVPEHSGLVDDEHAVMVE